MLPIHLHITPLSQWLPEGFPLLYISGPCSAENEHQLLATAKAIEQVNGVHIFRAGIWKPRTRPHYFEGVGIPGLKWLQNIKKQTKLKVMTEVATVQQLEACLQYDIDIVWIGARTSINPFAVQALADALKGTKIAVWVKNPVIADLAAWIGALERINQAGITKIGAIFRGFAPLKNGKKLRNEPLWHIPLSLQKKIPSLPIICDPSHIAGDHHLVANIAKKAINLGMQGLMIESHISPDQAWSDSKQQIFPHQLKYILNI